MPGRCGSPDRLKSSFYGSIELRLLRKRPAGRRTGHCRIGTLKDNYYQWNNNAAEYETVQPPPGLVDQVQTQAPAMRELFIYPKAGQSNEQLARDREDCHRWAVGQSGFDPTATGASSASPPANSEPAGPSTTKRADYLRAEGACLTGRNYSVE